ncbi:MAG: PQQ-binding-like beta-propeller repeat protein [Candidatus Aenigmatarchaeota archaeon]
MAKKVIKAVKGGRKKAFRKAPMRIGLLAYMWAAVILLLAVGLYTTAAPYGSSSPTAFAAWTTYQGEGQAGFSKENGPSRGELMWNAAPGELVIGSPLYDGQYIYFFTNNGNLYRTDVYGSTALIYNFGKDGMLPTPYSMPMKAKISLKHKVTSTNYEQGRHEYWQYTTHDTIIIPLTSGKILFIEDSKIAKAKEPTGRIVKELAGFDGRTQPIISGDHMFAMINGCLAKISLREDLNVISRLCNINKYGFRTDYGPTMTLYNNNIYLVGKDFSGSHNNVLCKIDTTKDSYANPLMQDYKAPTVTWCSASYGGSTMYGPDLILQGDIVGAPVVVDSRIYVATNQKMYVIYDTGASYEYSNKAEGDKAWLYGKGAAQQPTIYKIDINKHAIYYIDASGFVHLLNHQGKEVWSSPNWYSASKGPMLAAGYWPNVKLYLKNGDQMIALDGIDTFDGGKELWSYSIGEGYNTPIISGNTIFVGGENGLMALTEDTERPQITFIYQSRNTVETGYLGTDQITLSGEIKDSAPSAGLDKIEIQVKERDVWNSVTAKAFKKQVFGAKISADYTPIAKLGETVSWRIYAKDKAGNERTSSIMTFSMVPESNVDVYEPYMTGSEIDKAEVATYEKFKVTTTWQDDFELKDVTLIANENGVESEYYSEFDGINGESETREWYLYSASLGGSTINLRIKVCDAASRHGAAEDRCAEESIGSVIVRDIIPPKITEISQDKDTVKYNEDIKLSVKASDDGGLASVTYKLWDGENMVYVGGAKDVTETYTFRPSSLLQGQVIDWTATVTDLSGNTYDYGTVKRFRVSDTMKPKITAISGPSSVSAEDTADISAVVYDNETRVTKWELYVEYGGKTEKVAEGSPYSEEARVTPQIKATEAYRQAGTVYYYFRVTDEDGNVQDSTKKPLAVTVSCKQRDIYAPFAHLGMQSANSVLPGGNITFSAKISDDVDQYGCGGIKSAKLFAVGEDGIERTIGTIIFDDMNSRNIIEKKSYVEAGGATRYKPSAVWANFTWNAPEEYTTRWDDIQVTGLGAPTTNADLIGQGIVPGIFSVTGYQVFGGSSITEGIQGSAGASASKPFAIPGSKVKWYIKAYDYEGNEVSTFKYEFKVADENAPMFKPEGVKQSSARMLPGGSVKLSGCMADAGQLKEARFEVNFAGAWVGVKSFDLLPERVWAGAKTCKEIDYSNPAIKAGTDIKWRIRAADTEGNEAISGDMTFRVSTNPPTWSNKMVTPEKPLQGEEVTISIDWSDDYGLKEAVFSTNETGIWEERGRVSLVGTSDTAVFKWKNSLLTPGTVVAWKVAGIDTDGNIADSDPEFTIAADTTSPTWSDMSQSSDAPMQGEIVFLSAKFADNAGLQKAILETDESGEFKNMAIVTLSGKEATARFSWQNPNIEAGKTVKWRITAYDASNNKVTTNVTSFNVQAAPAVCPRCPAATDWTSCVRGKQTRTVYSCDATTGYECKAKYEDMTCVNTPQEIALYAIEDARAALKAAEAEGKDIKDAKALLSEAEAFYAGGNYVDAKMKADEAAAAVGAAPVLLKPVEILWVALGVVVAICGVVLVMMRKKITGHAAKKAEPADRETP